MTPEFWIQLCGLLLAGAGALGTVYGVLDGRISKAAAKLHERVDTTEGQLAEVKRDYVRRDDLHDDIQNLKTDIGRVERGQENVGAKMDQMTSSLIPVLARIAEAAASMVSRDRSS